MRYTSVKAIFMLLVLCINASAEDVDAETPEYQTLRAGLWMLNAGAVAEDLQVIKAFLYAENDPKFALVEAHGRRIIASKRFGDAAFKVFPQKTAQLAAIYRTVDGGDFSYFLLAPTWEIKGVTASPSAEEAAILARSEVLLPRLVNRQGVWKLDVTPTPKPTPAGAEALAAAVNRHAEVVSDVAAAIAAGKLTTLAQVEAELKKVPQFAEPRFTPDVVLALPSHPTTAKASEKTSIQSRGRNRGN